MKILLAVDGSKHSLDAVKSLIEHADWFSGKPQVFLAHVHLPVPKMGGFGPSKSVIETYYREEGEEALAKAVKLLDKAGLEHVDSILVGPVAETLCKHATANKVDLIYMGTRGLHAAANLVVGSVATKVLHNASVPVLLVK
jgi:nucleotide-binding universal stress UspA family protein